MGSFGKMIKEETPWGLLTSKPLEPGEAPKAPPPPPSMTDDAIAKAAAAEKRTLLTAQGRKSSFLTGPAGVATPKKSLLGQ